MDINSSNDSSSSEPSSNAPEEFQETELTHTDKIAGIFTEPVKTLESTAKFPVKTIDWLLPVFLFVVFLAFQQIIYHSNPNTAYQLKQKQMEAINKNLNSAVESGKMTQEQADQQRNAIEERMEKMGGIGLVFQIVGIFIVIFILFFIMAAIYFILAKFILKGEGSYSSVLVASGLPYYIGILAVIIITAISFFTGKIYLDTSVASFVGADKSNIGGWLLAKLDIFTIWSLIVLSIGLAKMFKSSSIQKYILMVFGVWIIGGLVIFFLAKAVPFLRFLNL